MRQTTWTKWAPDAMRDAAELEGYVGLTALKVPEQRAVATLPYSRAFDDYAVHVTGCTDCRRDELADCPEGAALLEVARAGLEIQQRMASQN
ncbi:hypothetical protein ABTY20_22870 [Streptomyces sp. NPDC126497]|uniref:hypothetical protein n=1 Tax=Streptomyces sp. NPDC126497 TaxID=3155313 RepID=UPI003321E900